VVATEAVHLLNELFLSGARLEGVVQLMEIWNQDQVTISPILPPCFASEYLRDSHKFGESMNETAVICCDRGKK
jgi:hypothetical protein